MLPADVIGDFLLIPKAKRLGGFGLGFNGVSRHVNGDRMLAHGKRYLTGILRNKSTGILRKALPVAIVSSQPMPQLSIGEQVRNQLRALKQASKLNDTDISLEMERRRNTGAKRIYQQKVSDFFSGEMKSPALDFLSLLCGSLGTKLSTVIAAAEAEVPIKSDDDWDWLMFGRRLGPDRRAMAVKTIEGAAPPVAPAAPPLRRKPSRQKRGAARD